MEKIVVTIFVILLTLHGLIHLMGLIAYWPLGKIAELPYKTTLIGARWEIGSTGTRIFSLLWLLADLGFLAGALGLALGRAWWAPLLLATALLSLGICLLDWKAAFIGVYINAALLLLLVLVFGLWVPPAPLPAFVASTAEVETMPLPAGLPAPVERFFRQRYGEKIPIYHSAVVSGHGTVRLMGITFPGSMRFSHIAGKDYHHYFEVNFYGLPILKMNEWYLDGHNRLELPFGLVKENDTCADSAANQGLWAESVAYPAIFLTDPRVRWEPIDETHASVSVPYGDSTQVFTMQFDPRNGELIRYETNRCLDAKHPSMHWWGDITFVESQDGEAPQRTVNATWENEGTPWLIVEVDEIALNADLGDYIRQRGP